MLTLLRAALASVIALVVFVGPVSAATNQTTVVAQAAETGTINGTVTGDSGKGVATATVSIDGAGQHQSVVTDDQGGFTATLPPGLYTVSVSKAGYQSNASDVAVTSGQSVSVSVGLAAVSLSSLSVIGRTTSSSTNAAAFNVSSSAYSSLSAEQLQIRDTPDLTQVVNELPGITIPHATTNPNQAFLIRGFRYETRAEIDGHPVSSGTGGTLLTNYAAAGIFDGVQVTKGPSIGNPVGGESGAGIVNLSTAGFSSKDSASIKAVYDSYQGTSTNLLIKYNLLKDDKLQFVLGRSFVGYRGPTYGQQEPSETGGFINNNGAFTPPNLTNNIVQYITDFSDTYSLTAELAKMRYKFSDATSLSAEFLGLQGRFDPQGGAYGQFAGYGLIPQCLNNNVAANGGACGPGSTYNSPAAQSLIGTTVPLYIFYPGSDVRQNQPNFNAEFKTTFKNDTILFRPYTAAINRDIDGTQESAVPGDAGAWYAVTNVANCQALSQKPAAGNGNTAKGPCFAAGATPVAAYIGADPTPVQFATTATAPTCTALSPCFTTPTAVENSGTVGYGAPYTTLEVDKLFGYTFSWIHPVGDNTYNISLDHYFDDAQSFVNDASPLAAGCSFVYGSGQVNPAPATLGNQPNCNLPGGALRPSPISVPNTFSSVTSLQAAAQFNLTSKWEAGFSGYFTTYLINAQQESPAVLAQYGAAGLTPLAPIVLTPTTDSASHFDPHFGLTYRASNNIDFRFNGGSSLTIPYANLVSGFATYNQGAAKTTINSPNYSLKPETTVTESAGITLRSSDGIVFTGDLYNIDVHNPWIFPNVQICGGSFPSCAVVLAGLEPTQTGFTSSTQNGAEWFGQGFEITMTNEPQLGLGYRLETNFERSYYMNNPYAFYATAGQTFFNGQQFQSSGSTSTSVPYAKAYGELQWAGHNKILYRVGADYEGSNNPYNAPAFILYDAGMRVPTGIYGALFGVSVENLTSVNWGNLLARGVAYQGLGPVTAKSVPGGAVYSSTTTSVGLVAPPPTTFRFSLTKNF